MSAAHRYRRLPVAPTRAIKAITGVVAILLAAGLPACGSPGATERSGGGASMDASSSVAQSAAAPGAAPAVAPETREGHALSDRGDGAASLGVIGSQSVRARDAYSPPPAPAPISSPLPAANAVNAVNAANAVNTSAAPSMVIRSGQASVEVDSLPGAIASIQRITASLGGYVGNTAIALGEDQVRRATIELKIPVTRYDDAVAGLSPLGKVESVNSSAEDVGEEFTDLTARITNAHRLETRLIALLAERTGKLQDALMVERELARVREEIERYEGRIRFLGARVAMSILTVNLHEPIPLVSRNPSESVLVSAAKDAWRNFVSLLALAISSLGVLLPVGAVGTAVHALYRRRVALRPAAAPRVTAP